MSDRQSHTSCISCWSQYTKGLNTICIAQCPLYFPVCYVIDLRLNSGTPDTLASLQRVYETHSTPPTESSTNTIVPPIARLHVARDLLILVASLNGPFIDRNYVLKKLSSGTTNIRLISDLEMHMTAHRWILLWILPSSPG